jgi:2-phospho-L-lactate guanylyltransferase
LTRSVHTLGPLVVAPSLDEVGTNLVLRRPPDVLPAAFGPDSYRRHLQAAAEREIPVSVVERRELGFDLDDPDDILTVLDEGRRTRTWEVCHDLDVRSRVGTRAVRR